MNSGKKWACIVLGLGYGDEGKGLTTEHLCLNSNSPIVIRFNGGHQAGHTVTTLNGDTHMFCNLGAGTFRGVPTYWSSYCTFFPEGLLREINSLKVSPKLLVDLLCPITTHYDILYNRAIEAFRNSQKHGSCGLGFGATIERQAFEDVKFEVRDLTSKTKIQLKLAAIRRYYRKKIHLETDFLFEDFDHDTADKDFFESIFKVKKLERAGQIKFVNTSEVFGPKCVWNTFIFEGAQGILLDMDFGIYPNVTRSNTTSKNALDFIQNCFTFETNIEIYYVTRCYATRHGAGPFKEAPELLLRNNSNESNVLNEHQGSLRFGYLDIESINYALKSDKKFSGNIPKNLVITCLDQLESEKITYHKSDVVEQTHFLNFPSLLDCDFQKYFVSQSPVTENLMKVR